MIAHPVDFWGLPLQLSRISPGGISNRVALEALLQLKLPRQGRIAVRALTGIPVNGAATLWATPSLLLLRNPSVNADFPLPLDVVQDFAMVTYAVIVKIDDRLTGEIRALSTVG